VNKSDDLQNMRKLSSPMSGDHRLINAMTVDVEDYFQVSAFERSIRPEDWDRMECRVERNMDRILSLFDAHGVRGTFFMLGWLAERYPQLVRRIVDNGHELASHGYAHVRVTQQRPDEFRRDVVRTKKLLEDISGRSVRGYRAASYSIGADNLWALDILREVGHDYSSSIYPIVHDLYGWPSAPRFAFHYQKTGLLEIPVTTVTLFNWKFPCGGGGYFRLLPYPVSRWALRRVNERDREPCVFYFHPWEIDATQPRQRRLSLKSRFRHYLNLDRMEARLIRLFGDFRWGRMDHVFLESRKTAA
jgi:polysaccharide deacetylase family protein (PEP-CTERM system associated)